MIDTIVDLNHWGQPDFAALVSAGITAVIHKATEGATFQDPEFVSRRVAAKAAGLLWGSYHFVSGVSVTDQLDNLCGARATGATMSSCAWTTNAAPQGPICRSRSSSDLSCCSLSGSAARRSFTVATCCAKPPG